MAPSRAHARAHPPAHLQHSAANDFWGKQFLALSGQKKMDQKLAIATGCAAGATESVVVVPFELVKIKCVLPSGFRRALSPESCDALLCLRCCVSGAARCTVHDRRRARDLCGFR